MTLSRSYCQTSQRGGEAHFDSTRYLTKATSCCHCLITIQTMTIIHYHNIESGTLNLMTICWNIFGALYEIVYIVWTYMVLHLIFFFELHSPPHEAPRFKFYDLFTLQYVHANNLILVHNIDWLTLNNYVAVCIRGEMLLSIAAWMTWNVFSLSMPNNVGGGFPTLKKSRIKQMLKTSFLSKLDEHHWYI